MTEIQPLPPHEAAARKDRIREARLARLRELLEQARAEHCFDNEDLDEADEGRGEVEALMELATTLSLQRRAGVNVGFRQAFAGADALRTAASSGEAIDAVRAELEQAKEVHSKAIVRVETALERERDAHKQTAGTLDRVQRELSELKTTKQ